MATEIEVTFAKSQSLPDTVPEGRLQLVDESAGTTEVEAYVGTQNGTKKITDKDKASIEDLKDGTLVPKLADNLTPYAEDSGTTQTQPFFLEGTATGNGESRVDAKQVPAYALLQEKRGNMVCVNQKVQNSDFSGGVTGWRPSNGTLAITGGIATLTCSADGNATIDRISYGLVTGHKNIVVATMKAASGKTLYISGVSANKEVTANGSWQVLSYIEEGSIIAGYPRFGLKNAVVGDEVQYSVITISDLTQWFNGNIPAYLFSHPEAFGRYYKGSLAYEPGRLEPATGRYLTSVGRNIWDEEVSIVNGHLETTNFQPCSPNTAYMLYGPLTSPQLFANGFTWYDQNKNRISTVYVGSTVLTSPSNACYFKFGLASVYGTTYKHDITITEYYSGESGYDKYYPYEVLATIDTGTESLYSAGSAYDSKVPSGLITRRIGSVDLGTLDWNFNSQSSLFVAFLLNSGNTLNVLCNKYTASAEFSTTSGVIFFANSSYIAIRDDTYTDTASFKAAMSGVMLYYELAEPTTEQGTPFQENVPIDDFGQLSWSNTGVPQGNQIFYPVDYKAYEDTLIKYTDGDATSLVRKTDYASSSEAGVAKIGAGVSINSAGQLNTYQAPLVQIKAGENQYNVIASQRQHQSVFYGLSRAAGVNLASSTEETAPDGTNPGVYPAAAKTAIQDMLGITDLIGDINTVLDSVNGVVI